MMADEKRAVVYLIADLSNNIVKIGFSTNLDRRIKDLSYKEKKKLSILHVEEHESRQDARINEKCYHAFFKKLSIGEEWFLLTDEILNFFKINLHGNR